MEETLSGGHKFKLVGVIVGWVEGFIFWGQAGVQRGSSPCNSPACNRVRSPCTNLKTQRVGQPSLSQWQASQRHSTYYKTQVLRKYDTQPTCFTVFLSDQADWQQL
jgi:hypothetical protein